MGMSYGRSFPNTELQNLSELQESFASCSFKFSVHTELEGKYYTLFLWFDHE